MHDYGHVLGLKHLRELQALDLSPTAKSATCSHRHASPFLRVGAKKGERTVVAAAVTTDDDRMPLIRADPHFLLTVHPTGLGAHGEPLLGIVAHDALERGQVAPLELGALHLRASAAPDKR